MTIKPGKYIHFKGNEYEVIGIAAHSETGEEMVVYRALYGEGALWVRPVTMWNEIVEHNGRCVKRFTHADDFISAPEPPAGIHKRSVRLKSWSYSNPFLRVVGMLTRRDGRMRKARMDTRLFATTCGRQSAPKQAVLK